MPVVLHALTALASYVTVPLALVALLTGLLRPRHVRAWYAAAVTWLTVPLRALLVVISFEIYERLVGPWLGWPLTLLGVFPFGPFLAAAAAWYIAEPQAARGFAVLGTLAIALMYGASRLRRSASPSDVDLP